MHVRKEDGRLGLVIVRRLKKIKTRTERERRSRTSSFMWCERPPRGWWGRADAQPAPVWLRPPAPGAAAVLQELTGKKKIPEGAHGKKQQQNS